jgi:hypothetical protein
MRNPAQEIIEAMQILIDNAMKKTTSVNSGIITAINNNGKYSVKNKGKINSLPAYPKNVKISSGDNVFIITPQGENNQAFILPISFNNMYGNIAVTDRKIDSTSTPLSDIIGDGFVINDKNDVRIGYIKAISLSTGEDGIEFSTIKNINNTTYYNSVGLFIDKNGNKTVKISDPTAWKTALGIS